MANTAFLFVLRCALLSTPMRISSNDRKCLTSTASPSVQHQEVADTLSLQKQNKEVGSYRYFSCAHSFRKQQKRALLKKRFKKVRLVIWPPSLSFKVESSLCTYCSLFCWFLFKFVAVLFCSPTCCVLTFVNSNEVLPSIFPKILSIQNKSSRNLSLKH